MNKALSCGGFCRFHKRRAFGSHNLPRIITKEGEEKQRSNLQNREVDNDQVEIDVKLLARR
jgi:hypothetical protein